MDETDAPDWDIIRPALRSLLFNFNLDLDSVGTSRRLDLATFEAVFYHIFIILDPQECRRKFWSSFPSRNPIERKQFVDRAAQLINEKKWYPARVTTSLLTMCGGAPFRRLLCHMIKRAINKEVELLTGKLNPELSDLITEGVDFDSEYISLQQELRTKERETFDTLNLLDALEEQKGILNSEITTKWNSIAKNFLMLNPAPAFDGSQLKLVYEKFVTCLEKSHTEIKSMTEQANLTQLKDYSPSSSIGTNQEDQRDPKVRESKRISDVIREMQRKLSMKDESSSEATGTKSTDWMQEQLGRYDRNMEALYLECERAVERSEEYLLRKPDFKARYDLFKCIVPSIDIRPIFCTDKCEPDLEKLLRMLPKYLDSSKYDVKEVIDCTKEYCK